MSFTRLQVCFDSLVETDIDEINDAISKVYPLSYMGKYIQDGKSNLYMQTSSIRIRMVPNKIRKILGKYGDITFIGTFKDVEGMADDDIGEIRRPSRKPKVEKGSRNTEKTMTINGDHNTQTLTDNSVTDNSVITINLHVHAFGNEDVSHISQDKLDNWIGKKDDVIKYVRDEIGEYMVDALRHKVYSDQYSKRATEWESTSEESRSENDKPMFHNEEDSPHDLEVEGGLMKELIEEYGRCNKKAIVTDFAKVLYDNPHNANVSINQKNGHFKIFDGRKWCQYEMPRLCEFLLENLRNKGQEALDRLDLNEKKFTRGFMEYINLVWDDDDKSKDGNLVRKRLANAVQDAVDSEISSIRSHIGKKIRRVNATEFRGKPGPVLSENSWSGLRETLSP